MAWTVVSIALLAVVTVAWGQSERSHAAVTEIWMSGEDLALTRRIPLDRRSARHSYEEVARSMVYIAESRYQEHDQETAEWLHQWARELTDGRIGSNPRDTSRQLQPESLEDEYFATSIPEFDSAGLAIEWPISAFNDESTPNGTQPIAHLPELPRTSWRRDDVLELVSEQEAEGELSADGDGSRNETRRKAYVGTAAVMHADSAKQPSRHAEHVVDPREDPRDHAGRRVAFVPSHMHQGYADHRHHAAPAVPTEQPTMLALSCFAAGVVCCFVLHTLLLLTPVRLTVRRPSISPSRHSDYASAQVTPTGEKSEPARAVSLSTRPRTPTRDLAQQQDKASSMVEEFYSSNIELFERFAQLGD